MYIHLIWILDISEHFEKFILIFNFNTSSSIYHWYFKNILSNLFKYFCLNSNASLLSKFQSIWLKVKQNLLYPLLIMHNYIIWQILIISQNLNFFALSLYFLNINDFLNTFSQIEFFYIRSKFILIYLWIIQ